MISAWTKHLKTDEDKKEFEKYLLGSKPLFDRQLVLIEELENGLDTVELSTNVYAIPNWDYLQADHNGYRRALRDFKKLADLNQ